jgi:hypothetical protein
MSDRKPNITGVPPELMSIGARPQPGRIAPPEEEDWHWRELWAPALDELPEEEVARIHSLAELLDVLEARGMIRRVRHPRADQGMGEERWLRHAREWAQVSELDDPAWPGLALWRERLETGQWPVEVGPMSDGAAQWLLEQYGGER